MPPSTPVSQQILTGLCYRTVAVPNKCIRKKRPKAEGYRHAGKQHRNPCQNTPVAECSLHPPDHIYRSNSANQWMETSNQKPEGLTHTSPKLMDMFSLIQWILLP